jgi:hypothetical protein
MLTKFHLVPLSLLLITAACADPKPATSDTDASTGGETGAETDDPQSSDSRAVDGATEGADPTTGGSNDTSPVDPEIVKVCQDLCAVMVECDPKEDLKDCEEVCSHEVAEMEVCREEYIALLVCGATKFTCEDFAGEEFVSGPCSDAWMTLLTCAEPHGGFEPEGCAENVEQSDSECSVTIECEGEPPEEFRCDAETCVCVAGGQEYAKCESEGVCMQGDAIFDKRAQCCSGG